MTGERFEQLGQFARIEHQTAGRFVAGEFLGLIKQTRCPLAKWKMPWSMGSALERHATSAPLALKRNHYFSTFDAGREGRWHDDGDFQRFAVGATFEFWSRLRFGFIAEVIGTSATGRRAGRAVAVSLPRSGDFAFSKWCKPTATECAQISARLTARRGTCRGCRYRPDPLITRPRSI